MQNENSRSVNIKTDGKTGRVTIRCADRIFTGMTLDAALAEFHAHLSGEGESEQDFHGFRIGDTVNITHQKTETIIAASGRREGFPMAEVNKLGTIVAFDRKTRSLNTVCVAMILSGKEVWGSHRELQHYPSRA